MYNEAPKKLRTKIKSAAGILNQHKCAVDTMLVAVGDKYFGYQPYPQPKKKSFCEVPPQRLEELSHAFQEAHDILTKANVELLVCFVSLEEGGASVFVAQEAVNRRLEVFKELEKMEEHHAKIS